MKCPTLNSTIIVSDDARLAARLSCLLATPGIYLPVVDGPRMTRHDREAETVRRNNAAARINAKRVILAGLPQDADAELTRHLPAKRIIRVSPDTDLEAQFPDEGAPRKTIVWGRDQIGAGLLRALRQRANIRFEDVPSPAGHVPSRSGHWVVCEDGEELSEVIAANYAHSLGAGLVIIPRPGAQESEALTEAFYGLYDRNSEEPQTARLQRLKARLRELCGDIPVHAGGSITFITKDLPYGFGFPEVPSTHLYKYPDLGISIVNGFAAEQPRTRGCNIAVLVDPETTDAPEIAAAAKTLSERGTFVRGYQGKGANVSAITDMAELFPYDLLIFATHCGDAPGYRWTYEYKDTEGLDRTLVVDIALSIGRSDDPDQLRVIQFQRFHSLDGVDWNDLEKKKNLHVGTAILDFIERTRGEDELQPTRKETISRVMGSAALKMSDHNLSPIHQTIANKHTPIIINNACVSWHELSSRFFFAGARAYVGTLFEVGTSEAHDVALGILGKHFGKPLAHALWSTQNAVYGDGLRRPYVVSGVYPLRLRVTTEETPLYIMQQLTEALAEWRARLARVPPEDTFAAKRLGEIVTYYEREVEALGKKWFSGV